MSDLRNNLVPTNIQELFLPLSRIHSYGTRSSTFQNFYIKKIESWNKKKTLSRDLVPNYGMRYRPSCAHFQNTNSNLIFVHHCLIYWRLAILIIKTMKLFLKWRKQNQFFCNPAYKNSELMFCFLFFLIVLNVSFSCFSSLRL